MSIPGAVTTVSVALLACLLTAAPVRGGTAAAILLTVAADEGLSTQLGDALTANGWARVEGADGRAFYRIPVARDQQPAEPAETGEASLAERLRQQLEQQGWVSSVAEDGSTIYRSPTGQNGPPQAAADTGAGTLADTLRRQLQAQGWRAAAAADGSVYYLPPAPKTPATPTLAEQLLMQLERQGWVGTLAEDGSMIYRSPDAAYHAQPAAPGRPAAGPPPAEGGVSSPLPFTEEPDIAPVPPSQMAQGFQIMSGDEIARHSAAMKSLRGPPREEYRNSHYEQLRRRAQEHDYWMPPHPPWASAAP